MKASLENFIESIQNAEVCLKTLKGIFPKRNHHGEMIITVSEYTAKFLVEVDGRDCRLVCLLNNTPAMSISAKNDLSDDVFRSGGYIAKTRFYEQEMLVFYDDGTSAWHDIAFQELPEGKPIDEFLIDCGERNDRHSPRDVLRSLADMSEWLYEERLLHQKLQLPNIIVRPDNTLALINLDMGRKLTPEQFTDCHRARDRDNLSIGYLGVILYVSSCTPKTYSLLRQGIMRRLSDLKKVLPAIGRAAEILEMDALVYLVKRLRMSNGRLPDREKLNRNLRAMIAQLPRKDISSSALTYYPVRNLKIHNLQDVARSDYRSVRCWNQYDWIGTPSDTLTRVESDGKYHFVDTDGQRINDLSYDFAYDFSEGRAVVVNGNDYALIDREGKPVIPFICEDMEWDPENGIAIAVIDGKWGVFDRCGEILIPMKYSWLGQFGNGLIVAQENDCYGYLRRDGSVAIPFIYEDAYSFVNEMAMVELNEERFLIDLDGNRVEDELEQADRQWAEEFASAR